MIHDFPMLRGYLKPDVAQSFGLFRSDGRVAQLVWQARIVLDCDLVVLVWGATTLVLMALALCGRPGASATRKVMDTSHEISTDAGTPPDIDITEKLLWLDTDADVAMKPRLPSGVKVFRFGQALMVLSPVFMLCLWAEWVDWSEPLHSMRGLRAAAIVSGVVAPVIMISFLTILTNIHIAQHGLKKKYELMSAMLCLAEGKAGPDVTDVSDLQELAAYYYNALQQLLTCENRVRTSIFSHLVTISAQIWLFTTMFNCCLCFSRICVPAVIAGAGALESWVAGCSSSWLFGIVACATTIAFILVIARLISCALTVWHSVFDKGLKTDMFPASARLLDSTTIDGCEVVHLLVELTSLVVSTNPLSGQFAVSLFKKTSLRHEVADGRRRLLALKSQLETHRSCADGSMGGGTGEQPCTPRQR